MLQLSADLRLFNKPLNHLRLVLVCIELFLNTVALELRVATLTDAKNGQAGGSYYDPELAFRQLAVQRIAQGGRNACGNQMVPLPNSHLELVCQKGLQL